MGNNTKIIVLFKITTSFILRLLDLIFVRWWKRRKKKSKLP